uniref:Uncharacterized protein n=1 Tax=Neogobius melanostomus TaxID=47308 RepID=A0A8C6V269_9GOBI
VAEDHGLCDGDGSVDVAERLKLLLFGVTQDVVLFDGVQRLLLPLQLYDVGVRDNPLGEVPHRLLERGREQQHLARSELIPCVPLYPDALVLVPLCSDHHVGLIQDKHADLLWFDELELGTPVQHGARCPDHYLLLQLHTPWH